LKSSTNYSAGSDNFPFQAAFKEMGELSNFSSKQDEIPSTWTGRWSNDYYKIFTTISWIKAPMAFYMIRSKR